MQIDKDIWSGIFLMALGALGMHFGADYAFGTTARMGPGFMPKILCGALVGIGVIVFLIGLGRRTDVMEPWAWGPLAAISAAVLAFGAVLEPVGLEAAILAAVIVSGTSMPAPGRLETAALAVACLAFTIMLVPSPLQKLVGHMLPWVVALPALAIAVGAHLRRVELRDTLERLGLAVLLAVLAVVVFVDGLKLALKSPVVLPVWVPIRQATVDPVLDIIGAIGRAVRATFGG